MSRTRQIANCLADIERRTILVPTSRERPRINDPYCGRRFILIDELIERQRVEKRRREDRRAIICALLFIIYFAAQFVRAALNGSL